jgi:hypothetical protein
VEIPAEQKGMIAHSKPVRLSDYSANRRNFLVGLIIVLAVIGVAMAWFLSGNQGKQPKEKAAAATRTAESGNVAQSPAGSVAPQVILTQPQNTEIFTGTWEGTYSIDSSVLDGTPTRGPFPMRMTISSNHAVSSTTGSQCEKWVGSGPGILACFGRAGLETLTVNEDGETATYFKQGVDTNMTGTLRKIK